jgi:SAM-dependent methyltransferase
LNPETTRIPVVDGSFDFVLAAGVIERFATDPNFFFFEVNRILRQNGHILITTPNVVCSENVLRILWRQVPNRHYFYHKDGSTNRHNLEYGPDLLKLTVENAGFAIDHMWTEDSWSQPRPDIETLIRNAGFPVSLRGDNLFFLCRKVSEPGERFPAFLYT